MQKCELVYLVLAAAFISVFTDKPVGVKIWQQIFPQQCGLGYSPSRHHMHCASLRRDFQRHMKEQLLIEL